MPLVCDCCGLTSHFHKHFHHNKLHGDTSTRISSMEIALYLQSVVVMDRQATFTDTSTEISSMEIALCL